LGHWLREAPGLQTEVRDHINDTSEAIQGGIQPPQFRRLDCRKFGLAVCLLSESDETPPETDDLSSGFITGDFDSGNSDKEVWD
jgi:hypothetical protein